MPERRKFRGSGQPSTPEPLAPRGTLRRTSTNPSARAPIVPEPPPVRGVVFIRTSRCKGCELCVEYCPVDVLGLSTDFNAGGYHYPVVLSDGCVSCQSCSTICPEFAIFAVPVELLDRAKELGLAV